MKAYKIVDSDGDNCEIFVSELIKQRLLDAWQEEIPDDTFHVVEIEAEYVEIESMLYGKRTILKEVVKL